MEQTVSNPKEVAHSLMTTAMKYEKRLALFTLNYCYLQSALRKCKLMHEYSNFKIKIFAFCPPGGYFFCGTEAGYFFVQN
jgi:hypothetical protein